MHLKDLENVFKLYDVIIFTDKTQERECCWTLISVAWNWFVSVSGVVFHSDLSNMPIKLVSVLTYIIAAVDSKRIEISVNLQRTWRVRYCFNYNSVLVLNTMNSRTDLILSFQLNKLLCLNLKLDKLDIMKKMFMHNKYRQIYIDK